MTIFCGCVVMVLLVSYHQHAVHEVLEPFLPLHMFFATTWKFAKCIILKQG